MLGYDQLPALRAQVVEILFVVAEGAVGNFILLGGMACVDVRLLPPGRPPRQTEEQKRGDDYNDDSVCFHGLLPFRSWLFHRGKCRA